MKTTEFLLVTYAGLLQSFSTRMTLLHSIQQIMIEFEFLKFAIFFCFVFFVKFFMAHIA